MRATDIEDNLHEHGFSQPSAESFISMKTGDLLGFYASLNTQGMKSSNSLFVF